MDIKRGDIWYIENGYATTGSEQRPGRPAVVVSNDRNNQHSTAVEVVYLTTQPKRDLPTHVVIRGTGQRSIALCEQVTTVSTERIGDYCGRTTDDEMAYIENALMISLGLSLGERDEPVSEETPRAGSPAHRNAGEVRRASGNVRRSAEQAHQGKLRNEKAWAA